MRLTPPRLQAVLLAGNLAILALPLAGLWALRLYESALIRQTESELVAQAAVLAGMFRGQLHMPSAASAPGTPPLVSAAGLQMARRQGLDLARDPLLPPQPDDQPGPPGDPPAVAAGQAIQPVLRDAQSVTLASLRVTDRQGVIVASTGSDLGRSLAGWNEVARALRGEPLVTAMHRREPAPHVPGGFSRTAGLRVFVALAVTDAGGRVGGTVVLSRTPGSVVDAIWGKRVELAGFLLALLAGGAGLALGISRLVTRPLGVVVAQAQAVASGQPMGPPPRPGTREVAELSAAIARMADTLARRADYIGSFAASVSHEFKTPMAAIRAAAELLEEPDIAPEERRRLLAMVGEGAARLELLVRRLVALARADVMRAGIVRAPTPVAPALARAAARHPRATVTAAEGTVSLPEEALDALLAGLLDNAATHAAEAAVRISAMVDGDEVLITVEDDGPGIPTAHRARIFEPFFTTARDRGGTGLGLPIAGAIAASVGGTVTLKDGAAGAAFVIRLPAGGPAPDRLRHG